ncbi:MAG: glycosyltransferase family 4 protein, partial [Acidobacteriota bacterium]|nr:glycosyltransferase family 4 protein [Acidobacteriota bacterium]
MKILKLSYEFPPIGGGGAKVVAGLADELVRNGHEIELVTMGFRDLPAEEQVGGVRVHRVSCGRASESKCTAREAARYVLAARPVLARLLEKNSYDLVHTHFIFPDGVLAWLEVARRDIPYIITAHGSDVPGYNPKRFFRAVHPVLRHLWKRVTRKARAIVSPSHELARLIKDSDPGTAVRVVPNGIDPRRFRPREKQSRILVATRFLERKGIQH